MIWRALTHIASDVATFSAITCGILAGFIFNTPAAIYIAGIAGLIVGARSHARAVQSGRKDGDE